MLKALVLFLYFFISSLIVKNGKHLIVPIYIIFNTFNDFIFFKIGFNAGEGQIYKLFNEILFLFIVTIYFLKKTINRPIIFNKNILILLLVSLITLTIGIFRNSFTQAVIDYREIFLPILTLLLLYDLKCMKPSDIKIATSIFIFCATINSIIAIFDYITFDGNYTNYWRYELLLQAKLNRDTDFMVHFIEYQLIRDGNLRASGFFASALEMGFFAAASLVFTIHLMMNEISIFKKLAMFVVSIILAAGIYTSQVRTAYLISLSFFILLFLMKHTNIKKVVIKSLVIIVPPMIVFLFFLFENNIDSSSIQRVYQYRFIFNNPLLLIPSGLGSFPQDFDSYFIYLFSNTGVLCISVFIFFYKKTLVYIDHFYKARSNDLHIVTVLITSFWVMSVQHFSGSIYYIFILYYLIIANDVGYWKISNGIKK